MEELKKMTLWDLLLFLQNKVKHNATIISDNAKTINSIDNNLNATPELLEVIKQITKSNSVLSKENSNFLKIFNSLVNLHKDYKQELLAISEGISYTIDNEVAQAQNFEDCLTKTLSGDMILDSSHPFINNIDFLNILLKHWSVNEDYEKCSLVHGILSSKSN